MKLGKRNETQSHMGSVVQKRGFGHGQRQSWSTEKCWRYGQLDGKGYTSEEDIIAVGISFPFLLDVAYAR